MQIIFDKRSFPAYPDKNAHLLLMSNEIRAREPVVNIEDVGERGIKAPPRAVMAGRKDNIAVLLSDVQAGQVVILSSTFQIIATEDIPSSYKIAIFPLEAGQTIINFGQVIGTARRNIQPGECIHTHNINPL